MVDPISSRIALLNPRAATGPGAAADARAAASAGALPWARATGTPVLAETGAHVRSLSASPPIGHAKVKAIATALQNSNYSIDPKRIAQAMIASIKK